MKRLLLLLPVLLMMLVTGCLKDDDQNQTIVLLGSESEFKSIAEVIPDTLLAFITDATAMDSIGALSLPTGNMPPDIQGEYIFCPIELCADNGHGVTRNDTIFFRFGGDREPLIDTTGQTVDTVWYYPEGQCNVLVPCDLLGDVMEEGDVYLLKSQSNAYVMGHGKNFTAYFTLDYECKFQEDSFKMKRGYIITGTVSSSGIDQAIMACVNVSVDVVSNSSYSNPPEKDYIYVYRVKETYDNQSRSAKRFQWCQN